MPYIFKKQDIKLVSSRDDLMPQQALSLLTNEPIANFDWGYCKFYQENNLYYEIIDNQVIYYDTDIQKMIDKGHLSITEYQKVVNNKIVDKDYNELNTEQRVVIDNNNELTVKISKFKGKKLLVYGVTNLLLAIPELIPFSILCQTSPKIAYYPIEIDNILYSYACFDYINQAHWNILKKHIGTILTLETFDGDDIEVKVNDKFKYIV